MTVRDDVAVAVAWQKVDDEEGSRAAERKQNQGILKGRTGSFMIRTGIFHIVLAERRPSTKEIAAQVYSTVSRFCEGLCAEVFLK